MSNSVIGLDMSLTRTGICADGICDSYTAPGPDTPLYRRSIAVRDWLRGWVPLTSLVVTEDIGTNFTRTAMTMAYLHCQLDSIVDDTDIAIVRVSPGSVKKYATGKGNADKDAMLLAAIRAGATVENNDESDAWWMYAIGAHLLGNPVVDVTKYRTDVTALLAEQLMEDAA